MQGLNLNYSSRYLAGLLLLRWPILAVWLAVVVASSSLYLTKFRIDNSVAIWFLEHDPEVEDYREHLAVFGEAEWTYLWLRTDAVFAPEFLRDLQDLGARIKRLEHVHRVVALTDGRAAERDPAGQMRLRALYPAASGLLPSAQEVASFRAALEGAPAWREAFLAGEETFTVVAIQNDNLISEEDPYRIELIDRVRELVAGYPAIQEAGLVGTTVINAELNRAARRDMLVYYILIAAFVLGVGGIVLRHRRDLLVLLAVLAGTIMPVMGGAAALGFSFNLMTVMVPTLLVTVAVSYLVHFMNEFHLVRAGGSGAVVALAGTIARLWKPGFWTAVTTAVGFLSLTVSEVAPVRQVGWMAAGGIAAAWVTTLTVGPVLLSVLWSRAGEERRARARPTGGWVSILPWVARPRPLVLLGFGSLVVGGALGLLRLEADTNYLKFFREGDTVRTDYGRLQELGLPQSSFEITISLPRRTGLADLPRHRRQTALERDLRALPEVRRIESLDGLVEQLLPASGTDREGSQDARRELLAAAENGALPGAGEFVSRDGRVIRLRVMIDYLGMDALLALRARMEGMLRDALPAGFEVDFTGTDLLWANMDEQVIRTQIRSIAITSGVVIVLLPVVFRSVVLGVLGFVVSFVPIVCTLGMMAWMGLPVNIATCLLGGVVIGLAVDDTIYFVSRVRDGLDAGHPLKRAVRESIFSTGRAMVYTSVILTGGFLTMAASDFLPSVYFGVFFAASIVIALLADLVLLPAMLRACERFLPRKR